MTNEKKELLQQLHNQYYEDNRSRLRSMLTISVALLGVIGAYGVVTINSTTLFCTSPTFTHLGAIVTAMVTLAIITLLYDITLQIGLKCRMEQLVCEAIREKLCPEDSESQDIFQKAYTAKGKKWHNFIPNIYGELLPVYIVTYVCVEAMTIFLLVYDMGEQLSVESPTFILFLVLSVVVLPLFMLCKYIKAFYKYNKVNNS